MDKRRELITQTLLITGLLSLVVGIIMFLCADIFARQFDNPQLATWIRIFALFPITERIIQLLPAFLISLDKALHSGIYSMSAAISAILSVVVVFWFGYGITAALWTKIVVGAVAAFVGVIIMASFTPGSGWRFNKDLCLQQINYCWPLMATTIVGVINLHVGGFLISSYFPADVYAVYSTGALELPLIALFTSSISSAIMPNMVVQADKGNMHGALNLWHEATRKSSLLIFPTFVIFLVCGQDFIVVMFTEAYKDATWPFLIYLARLPVRVAIYATIFRAIGDTRPIAIAAAIAFMTNLIVSVVLLIAGQRGFLSFIAPSIGAFSGTIAAVIYHLLTLCKKMHIRFSKVMRWRELGRIFGISLCCGILLWFIPVPVDQLFFKLAIRFSLFGLLYAGSLVITRSLKPDEWELVLSPVMCLKKAIQ